MLVNKVGKLISIKEVFSSEELVLEGILRFIYSSSYTNYLD